MAYIRVQCEKGIKIIIIINESETISVYNNNDYYYVKHMCNSRIRHDGITMLFVPYVW